MKFQDNQAIRLNTHSDNSDGSFGFSQSNATRKKVPFPHQKEAVRANLEILRQKGSDIRTQDLMACGTGKTLVGQWTAEALGNRNLYLEPSLAMVAQTLKSTRENTKFKKQNVIVVCSDDSIYRINNDEPLITPEDLGESFGVCVTTDPAEARAFLQQGGGVTAFSTYHSSPVLADAMRSRQVEPFHCTVVDEAHYTATREDKAFATILDSQGIKSRTRLFQTATPKIYLSKDSDKLEVYSMDDVKLYGDVAYSLPFSKAISDNLLTDYQVVVAAVPKNEYEEFKRAGKLTATGKMELAELAFLRAAQNHTLSKVITFHNSVAKAHSVSDDLEYSANRYLQNKNVWAHAINGKMPSRTREHLLETLASRPASTLSVVCNCRVLGVGVDIKALDGIAFFDPKDNAIDIAQAVGRVMRKMEGKRVGTIIIPVVIDPSEDPSTVLESSEFKKLWQVIRALRSHDDRMEIKFKQYMEGSSDSSATSIHWPLSINIDSLPDNIKHKLETRIVQGALGLKSTPLRLGDILRWAESYFDKKQAPPSSLSGPIEGTKENWGKIDAAINLGIRGLQDSGFKSLADFLRKKHSEWYELDLDQIDAWAIAYYSRHKSPPSQDSGDIDGQREKWGNINSSFVNGLRGLNECGFKSIPEFLRSRHPEWYVGRTQLNLEDIDKWAQAYHKKYNSPPTSGSGPMEDANDNWRNIDAAFREKRRGLEKSGYSGLPQFLKERHPDWYTIKKSFSLEQIDSSANAYYEKFNKPPTQHSGQVEGLDDTWRTIDRSFKSGHRGLKGTGFKSLPDYLKQKHPEWYLKN